MDTVDIKGTLYKKSSLIAEDFGYTTDYVGQLCRSGKVAAQMVGRSWYVDPESVQAYREHRYEPDEAQKSETTSWEKSRPAAQVEYKKSTDTQSGREEINGFSPLRQRQGFALPQYVRELSYEEDTADLVPVLKKPEVQREESKSNPIAVNIVLDKKPAKTPPTASFETEIRPDKSVIAVRESLKLEHKIAPKSFTVKKKQVETLAFAKDNKLAKVSKINKQTKVKRNPPPTISQNPAPRKAKNSILALKISLFTLACFVFGGLATVAFYGVSVLSYEKDSEYMVLSYEVSFPENIPAWIGDFIHAF